MSNNGFLSTIGKYINKVRDFGVQTAEGYQAIGKGFVSHVETKYGAAHGVLASRVYSSALEVLINVCALTGLFAVPACVVLAAKRIFPLHAVVTEAFRSGGSKEALLAKWKEVVESYKSSLKNTIAPALMVALATDALFCTVFGFITLNPLCLLRAFALSGPAAYYIYKTLIDHCEDEVKQRPPAPDQREAQEEAAPIPAVIVEQQKDPLTTQVPAISASSTEVPQGKVALTS